MFNRLRHRMRGGRPRGGDIPHPGDAGTYTKESAPRGAGHYVFDPASDCPVHSRRLEALCDLDGEPIAREELHGHAENLSYLGIDAGPIRVGTDPLIEGRRKKRTAAGQAALEREMASLEGDIESAPERAQAERTKAERSQGRARECSRRAETKEVEAAELQRRHGLLDRRYRISPSKALIALKAAAVVLYDLGVVAAAFSLIPGTVLAKVLLAIGLAFAPLAAAIGLAAWLSAANHRVRFGRAAGRYALLAALLGGIGLLLMIPFRSAALGDEVIPPLAFGFLSVAQIALLMSETASWMVWFDAKVGRSFEQRIAAVKAETDLLRRAEAGHLKAADAALLAAEEIERGAARDRALLRREEPLRREVTNAEDGSAEILKGGRDTGILEGIAADNREAESRAREGEAAPPPRAPVQW